MNWIRAYCEDIRAGRVVVSAKVRKVYFALEREAEDDTGRYVFDEALANRPIEFIERFCRHSKGEWAGTPVVLETWQKAFISAIFGFVDRETRLRRFREALLEVGRKNGKSLLAASLALYMLIADGEPGAEVYSTATKRDQAKIVFDEAHNMVNQSPELRRFVKKRRGDLYAPKLMAKFQPLGKNSDTLDGLNASCVIMDELHGVKTRDLYEVMKQSQSARRQPLLLMITTAGTVRESIFDDTYSHAEKVISGEVQDDTFLAVVYELDEREEWRNPDCWQKANPGLGTIKKRQDLVDKVRRAEQEPEFVPGLLCKDFDVRSSSHTAWLQFEDINNEARFDVGRFKGRYFIGGADLSITTDLTCATALMVDPVTEERFVKQMYWIPGDGFEARVEREKIPYDKWRDAGLLRLCRGNTIRPADVTQWFLEVVNEWGISPAWVYYDSYSARYWVDEMESHGFPMVRCIQGAKTLSLPMQQLGQDLRAKRVNYDNNPILKWCLTNTGVQVDRNANIVPVKSLSPKMRIDGTASLLDAYVGLCDHYNEFMEASR